MVTTRLAQDSISSETVPTPQQREDISSDGARTVPFVSVLMPIRNESGFIERSLGAILAQDYSSDDMEILVIDGMSTDDTRQVVSSLQAEHPNLTLITNERKYVSYALNLGIEHAQGDVIVLVGGHTEIAPDYLERCVEHLQKDDVDAVGGPVETIGETPMARTIAAAMSSSFGVGGCAFRTVNDKTMLVDTAAFAAYSRAIVERAGRFDEELVRNQDDEYNYRLRKLGGKILLSEAVRSRYYSRGTIRKLWSQYFQYGYWKVRVTQKHPRQMKPRHFIPAAFVLILLLAAMMAPFSQAAFFILCSTLSLYGAANLIATICACSSGSWKQLPLLPLTFATLHFSYGLGFLAGLVRFAPRWRNQTSQP